MNFRNWLQNEGWFGPGDPQAAAGSVPVKAKVTTVTINNNGTVWIKFRGTPVLPDRNFPGGYSVKHKSQVQVRIGGSKVLNNSGIYMGGTTPVVEIKTGEWRPPQPFKYTPGGEADQKTLRAGGGAWHGMVANPYPDVELLVAKGDLIPNAQVAKEQPAPQRPAPQPVPPPQSPTTDDGPGLDFSDVDWN